ncbi:MAG: rRNA maturation RNase YbeY [Spirochaetae bacterium HGW-Spirochaetae-6]|nr:MAG: rRNA maturation RNase YbeY [Spirochaetae bacterium HGW-Spirochaetae-6]
MLHNTEVDNQTSLEIVGVQELLADFLQQMDYQEETEISVVFCNNQFIKELNLKYRGLDEPTDVLSFSAEMQGFLGDIVISPEKAQAQAEEGLKAELELLLCHGLLHLLGYDHETGEEDAEEMFALQKKLLMNKQKDISLK